LTVDMRAVVITALLVAVAGCGGEAAGPSVERSSARPHAHEIVYLYRVQGDDPMPDSIRLYADGTADIRRGGGGSGIRWIKAALDRHELARVERLVAHTPWKALDGTTVEPGGFGGWDNDVRYMLRRGQRSITVVDSHLPHGVRPLIRELDAIIENDKGRRLSSLLTAPRAGSQPVAGSSYALIQMNLCLSGLAGCYRKVAYPAALDEAVARIRAARPDAVTLNEVCRGDVTRIARRTGYNARFSRVVYDGQRLPCVKPGGRGLFGDAVLTKSAVERTETQDFEAQAGPERRRWLCVSTRAHVDVCTAHLNTLSPVEAAGNAAQCDELAALLARRAATRTVIFGGDVNRRDACAPRGFWARTDTVADQAPGLQHVYGSGAVGSPSAHIVPATHTDHDMLVVRARL
jgi:endonuclease/exonuclease/phosphatase family metal-dependent hydrolase